MFSIDVSKEDNEGLIQVWNHELWGQSAANFLWEAWCLVKGLSPCQGVHLQFFSLYFRTTVDH
jgi:hypothetical protein